jgi:hypothetical protein
MSISIDKYLPEVTETTSIADVDLIYITGIATGDYKVFCKNLRGVLNPCLAISPRSYSSILLASGCAGNWYSNQTAIVSIFFKLPTAVSGLLVSFVVESAYYLTITPQAGDKIVSLAVDGQSIRSNALQDSIVLKATDNDWYVISKNGTWSAV